MNTPYVFKKCSKCGRWLVASKVNFYKQKRGKYGLRTQCKKCVSAYDKEQKKKYYEENKEDERRRSKKRYEENKEEILRQKKKYYKKK